MRENDSDEEAAAGKSAALLMSQVDEGNTSFASSSHFSSSSSSVQESESDQEEQTKSNYKSKQDRRHYLQKIKHTTSHARHSVHKMSEVQQLQNVTNQLQQSILQMSTFDDNVPDVVHFKVQNKVFAIEQRHLLHDVNSVLFVLTQEHYARQRREQHCCLTDTAKRKLSQSSSLETSALHTLNRKALFVPKSTRSTECWIEQYDECNTENMKSSIVIDSNENKNDDIVSRHSDKSISNIIQHEERALRKRVRDEQYNEYDSSEYNKKCFTTNCTTSSNDNRSKDNIDDKTNSNTMSKWKIHLPLVEESNATHNHCECKRKQEEEQQHEEVPSNSRTCTKKEMKTKHDTLNNEEFLCNKVEFIEIIDRDPNLFAMLINLLRGYKNAIPRQWRDACRAEAEYYGLQKSFNARYPASDHYFFYCPLERPMLTSEMVCHYASPPLERGLHIIHFAIVQSDRVGIGVRRTDVSLDALMDSHDFTGTALLWNDGKVTTHFGILESYFSGWAYSAPIVIDVELDLDANLVKWMINGEFDAAVHRLPSNLPFAFFVIAARNSQVKIV